VGQAIPNVNNDSLLAHRISKSNVMKDIVMITLFIICGPRASSKMRPSIHVLAHRLLIEAVGGGEVEKEYYFKWLRLRI